MVQKLEISGEHYKVDEKLHKYIVRKIGRIDKYLSRAVQPSTHIEVRLKEEFARGQKVCVCVLTMHLPHEVINLKESTRNMYASIDIIQAKLKQQVQRYKELHGSGSLRRRLFNRRSGQIQTI